MAFTDIDSPQYEGKTNDKKRNSTIDANFALIEAGGAGAVTVDSLVCTAGATFGGGAGATGVSIGTTGTLTMGAQGTGVAINTADPFGLEVHSQHASDVVTGGTGLSCGIRSRYEVSVAQSTQIALVAVEGRLRVKAAIADGNHAGVMGTIESDASIAFTGTSTTQRSAGAFALELGASCTLSAGFLCGVSIDSSVNGNVDMSNVEFCGVRIKTSASAEVWEHGLYIDDGGAVTGITLGTCTTGIQIGACTTAGINITGTTSLPINIAPTTTANTSMTPIKIAYSYLGATNTGTDIDMYGVRSTITQTTSNAQAGALRGFIQGMRSDAVVNGYIADAYSLYAKMTVAGTSVTNQLYGLNSVFNHGAFGITMDETGFIAGVGVSMNGSGDVTCAGTGYGKVAGMYIFWNETHAMTVDTCGVHIGVNASALLDSGYRINTDGTTVNAFHSYNASGTITSGLKLEGAHTAALSLPAEGTSPCVSTGWSAAGADAGTVVKIAVLIGGATYYILASTAPTGS